MEALTSLWDAFVNILTAIITGDFSALLEAIGDFFLATIKVFLALLGIDGSFFDKVKLVAKKIINNPGLFFTTLGKGVCLGFEEFGKNIKTNLKICHETCLIFG